MTLVLAVLVGSTIGAGQRSPFAISTNAFAVTQTVLKIFYPEIFGSRRQVVFSAEHPVDSDVWGEFTGFQFTIKRFSSGTSWDALLDPKTGKLIAPPENTTFLEGSTWVTPKWGLIQLNIEGDLANSKQNEAIAKLVESHPEWSDEQAAGALKSAGALYGPADTNDFTKSLHLPELEKSLGLKVDSAENAKQPAARTYPPIQFQGWTNSDHVGSFVGFVWSLRMEADFRDGHTRKYSFTFEPFQGKLTGIYTRITPGKS
ncbi:MAG: hypothetical protein WCA00_21900 [Candidatus Acidiferrales bacterium]